MADDEKKTLAELPVPRCPGCFKKEPGVNQRFVPMQGTAAVMVIFSCASCGNILGIQCLPPGAVVPKNKSNLILPIGSC